MDDLGYLLCIRNNQLVYTRDKELVNKKKKIVFKGLEEIKKRNSVNKMSVSQRAKLFLEKTLSSVSSDSEDDHSYKEQLRKAVLKKKQEIIDRLEKRSKASNAQQEKNEDNISESANLKKRGKRKHKRRSTKNSTQSQNLHIRKGSISAGKGNNKNKNTHQRQKLGKLGKPPLFFTEDIPPHPDTQEMKHNHKKGRKRKRKKKRASSNIPKLDLDMVNSNQTAAGEGELEKRNRFGDQFPKFINRKSVRSGRRFRSQKIQRKSSSTYQEEDSHQDKLKKMNTEYSSHKFDGKIINKNELSSSSEDIEESQNIVKIDFFKSIEGSVCSKKAGLRGDLTPEQSNTNNNPKNKRNSLLIDSSRSKDSIDHIFNNFKKEVVKDQEEISTVSIGKCRVERITRQRRLYEKMEREAQKKRELEEKGKLRVADFLQSKQRLMRKRNPLKKSMNLKGSHRFVKRIREKSGIKFKNPHQKIISLNNSSQNEKGRSGVVNSTQTLPNTTPVVRNGRKPISRMRFINESPRNINSKLDQSPQAIHTLKNIKNHLDIKDFIQTSNSNINSNQAQPFLATHTRHPEQVNFAQKRQNKANFFQPAKGEGMNGLNQGNQKLLFQQNLMGIECQRQVNNLIHHLINNPQNQTSHQLQTKHMQSPKGMLIKKKRKKSKKRKSKKSKNSKSRKSSLQSNKKLSPQMSNESQALSKTPSIIMNIHTTNNFYNGSTQDSRSYVTYEMERNKRQVWGKNKQDGGVTRVDQEGNDVKIFNVDLNEVSACSQEDENSWDN